jgi:hypothetical protein
VSNQPPQGPPEGWESRPQGEGSQRPTEPQWPTQGPQWGTQPPTTQPEPWQPRPPEQVPPQPLSDDERRAWLAQQVDEHLRNGWQIESRTENLASLRIGKPINHVLHLLLTLVTCGVWVLVWIYLAMFQGERRKTISTADADRAPKAVKPWYKETRFLIAMAVILVIVILAAIPPD